MKKVALVLVGIALAFFPLFALSRAQTPLGGYTAARIQHPAWPPHPSRLVSLSNGYEPVNVFPGAILYTVPDGHYFVLTAFQHDHVSPVGGDAEELLEKRTDGTETTKSATGAQPGGPIGAVFSPGSDVVLRNIFVVNATAHYKLSGYLTPVDPTAPIHFIAWPPRPTAIIDQQGTANYGTTADANLYTVPDDAWLVITSYICRTDAFSGGYRLVLLERGADNSVTRRGYGEGLNCSPIGAAFSPGSTVSIEHQGFGGTADYLLKGYLAQ